MTKPPRRPKPFNVGPRVGVRPIRGPKDGRWYWQARYWNGDTSVTCWAGWGSAEEVGKAVADVVARDGLDKPAEESATVETVTDLVEYWVATVEDEHGRGDVTLHALRNARQSARHIKAVIGEITVEELGIRDIESYVSQRRSNGAAPATVHLEVKALRRAWKWARKRGYVPTRDLPELRDLHLRPDAVREKRTPTDGEVAAALGHLRGWARMATILLFGTGARVGEISILRWKDCDLDAGVLTIAGKRKARDRGPRMRRVPILASIVAALRAWHPETTTPDTYVLGVSPKLVTGHLSSKHLKAACEAAGVPKFSPHGLRRSAVDAFLRSGVDVGTAAAHFGHSPEVMLSRYRKATLEDQHKAVAMARLGQVPAGEVLTFPVVAKRQG